MVPGICDFSCIIKLEKPGLFSFGAKKVERSSDRTPDDHAVLDKIVRESVPNHE